MTLPGYLTYPGALKVLTCPSLERVCMLDSSVKRWPLTDVFARTQDRGRGVGQVHHPLQGRVGEVQSQPDLQLLQEQDVQHSQQDKGEHPPPPELLRCKRFTMFRGGQAGV